MVDNDVVGNSDVRESRMYKFFYKNLPQQRSTKSEKTLDVASIAYALKISDKAIYAWFNRSLLPAAKMKKLIELPGSTLTYESLSAWTKG